MREQKKLEKIVHLCLSLDTMAMHIYGNLAKNTAETSLRDFWEHMANEENSHLRFWERMLQCVQDGLIPQIFADPGVVLKGLRQHLGKIEALYRKSTGPLSSSEQFMMALQLEFYLLYPALDKIWHFVDMSSKEFGTPEDTYTRHIEEFIDAMKKHRATTPEMEFLGTALSQMWAQVKEMAREAYVDEVTRIFSRKGVFDAVKMLANFAGRNGLESAILLIDIDHFKVVNDTHGHQEGDRTLARVAGILKTSLRQSDVIGRYGGEEFIIFLPKTDGSQLESIAEMLRDEVEKGTRDDIPVTVSIGGVSASFSWDVDPELKTYVKEADICLYLAKKKGRNQVVIGDKRGGT